MRIIFFSPYFYPYTSGLTTYPLAILTQLAKKHDVTVLTFRHQPTLPANENLSGLKIIRLPYLFKISKGFLSPHSLPVFWQQARRADLIFLNIPNFEGAPLAILAYLRHKPVISIFHCLVHLPNSLINNLIGFFLNLSIAIQLATSSKIIGYTKDYASHTFVGKLYMKKMLFVLPPIQKLPISDSFLSRLKKEKKSAVWIGFSGRVATEKGLEYLIQAAQELKKKIPNLSLMFAGPYGKEVSGEEKYYLHILSLLQKTSLRFQFLGNLAKKDLGAFYRAIDVLALLSVNSTEAFGMVQAESMLLGTPVIATDLPGVRVPIGLTKMGLIVKPKDVKQTAEAMIVILKNKQQYASQQLVDSAKQIFQLEKTVNFYTKLLNFIL
ncbi:hypothetical protein A3F03_04180 [Candidatus Roizmanbacteria bacterium RIFCSPHIGHO2_12_FULL_41_11]|uniref:Glycosyl transferase family 1 domain-containing protein n=3 Tax=Candidatus Roizmaniibacteriota TaxID=1752723 RepID=A0A1F7JRA8_9BACT|nr:MAG: hypothetical protein A3F03_04180 [Candidatus Roizmanbacteria bacterium RIFCSPHIGHO2_12_FULL_41_11]OGK51005.1 MAG: hypothetical protein A2966_02755 [Candidatus Roizmanbacteria bacterium RIFCSPLOWO2_01_FULL_41_22]OGK58150.1 MAG: hypothetical protein A3H86_04140 [Candidatus Roizmanbacteria bacterium RIFCSPLOWO2_02_FULL_41_9]